MAVRFFDLLGKLGRARRSVSSHAMAQKSDVEDPQRLADVLREMQSRVAALEAAVGQSAVEFELDVPDDGTVSMDHGLGGSIRWSVVHWYGSAYGPCLSTVPSAVPGRLTLRSALAGRAVVRVEQSQYAVQPTQDSYVSAFGPEAAMPVACNMSLSATSTDRTSEVASTTSVYLTAGVVPIWTGTAWRTRRSAAVTIPLGTLTNNTNYDVFAGWDGTKVTAVIGPAWSSDSVRSLALSTIDGVEVSAAGLTYMGTFRTSSTTTTVSTRLRRYVWSRYGQIEQALGYSESANSWTYVSPNQVWRQARATTTTGVEMVCGLPSMMKLSAVGLASPTTASGTVAVGIGLNSTTVNAAQVMVGHSTNPALYTTTAEYVGHLPAGYTKANWLETGNGTLTYTFYGTAGTAIMSTGLIGTIRG